MSFEKKLFIEFVRKGQLTREDAEIILKRREKQIRKMSHKECEQELLRVMNLALKFAKMRGNARCWHEEAKLAAQLLGLQWLSINKMDLPEEVLLRNCKGYIRRQQCSHNGCSKSCTSSHHG